MRYFIRIFFVLMLNLALWAENEEQVASLPAAEPETQEEISTHNTSESIDVAATPQETPVASDDLSDTETSPSTESASEETSSSLETIYDIRPAVNLPVDTWQIIALVGLICIGVLALFYMLKKRRKNKKHISVIPLNPYSKALQQLETALQLIQRPDQRPFANGITDAVREYLAAVFGLPAPECTTEEVLEQLPNVALLTEEIRQNITHLLQQCDLAKFTKLQFDQPERLKLYHQAKEFVRSADKLIQLQNVNTTQQ